MMNGRMAIITLAAASSHGRWLRNPASTTATPLRVQYPSQPLSLADVKMLAKSGVSDEVILSQIRNSHTVYHLSAAEILDLKDAGLSDRVMDFHDQYPDAVSLSAGDPPSY